MIAKTGANYQAEGGYIEFATGVNNVTINGVEVPSVVYPDSIKVSGLQKFTITLISGASGPIRYTQYTEITAETGEKFFDYQASNLAAGATANLTLPSGFGSTITPPSGYHPKLAEGSKNVKIVSYGAYYFLITVGESPKAIIELEENV